MEYQNEPSGQSFSERGDAPPPAPSNYESERFSSGDKMPPVKPNNWLWQSIVATLLCCMPFGIVSIIFATRVNSLYFSGQYAEAEQASKKARLWVILSVVAFFINLIVSIIMFVTGDLPEVLESIMENNASGYNF